MEFRVIGETNINPLNSKLNPICHLLALLGAHHILHISMIRVKDLVPHNILTGVVSRPHQCKSMAYWCN